LKNQINNLFENFFSTFITPLLNQQLQIIIFCFSQVLHIVSPPCGYPVDSIFPPSPPAVIARRPQADEAIST
jgi:hypothetical protein